MVLIAKQKTEKTAKGYRLKKSTHKLIDRLQVMLNADQNTVITRACKSLFRELSNKIKDT